MKVSITEKEAWGYAKVIQVKKYWKNGQVSKISKTMGSHMPAWKRWEVNKIAHVFLQKCLKVSIKRYVSWSIVELG